MLTTGGHVRASFKGQCPVEEHYTALGYGEVGYSVWKLLLYEKEFESGIYYSLT